MVTPAVALTLLQEGNARFATDHAQHPHADAAWRADLAAHGQHPFATVVACSDSRVPVELLFDEGVGDLFVIRVAGNVCDVDEVGSVEYAVAHLGTPLMVVLGHSHCGAVTAVATDARLEGNLPRLLDNILPAVDAAKKAKPHLHGEALIESAVTANVWQAVEDLFRSSEIARDRCKAGELKVVGAIYSLESGKVEWLGEHPRQQQLLKGNGAQGKHTLRKDQPAANEPLLRSLRAGLASGQEGVLQLLVFTAGTVLITGSRHRHRAMHR
ncbi:MAG: hypothetical protein AMXMBFR13_22840 [Phycisphaerae bacterium]